jgi:hypothetical protein
MQLKVFYPLFPKETLNFNFAVYCFEALYMFTVWLYQLREIFPAMSQNFKLAIVSMLHSEFMSLD